MLKVFTSIWLGLSGDKYQNDSLEIATIVSKTSEEERRVFTSIQNFSYAAETFHVAATPSISFISPVIKASSILKDYNYYKTACCTIMVETSRMLSILISAHKPIVGQCHLEEDPFGYKNLKERFGREEEEPELRVREKMYTDLHRLQKIVTQLIALLKEVCDEILYFSEVTALTHYAEVYEKHKKDERDLFQNYENKKQAFQDLLRELKDEKENSKKNFHLTDLLINEKNVEFMDLAEKNRAEMRYGEAWEDARQEQNTLKLTDKENSYKARIGGMENQMYLEDICHQNIQNFYEESKEDYSRDIERWMETYDHEMERRDMDILNMKHEISKLQERKELLQQEIEKRQQRMNDWLEYKRLKKEKEERIALENWAATKIEAWWRGVMVRKKLGPYRKKKKGKKKGDKKGKKNKK